MVEAGGSIQGLSGPSEIGAKCMVMGAAPGTIGENRLIFTLLPCGARRLSPEPISKQTNISELISQCISCTYR